MNGVTLRARIVVVMVSSLLAVSFGSKIADVNAVAQTELTQTGVISGSIRDAQGIPVGGAEVQAISDAGEIIGQSISDGGGKYSLRVDRGTYRVCALIDKQIVGDAEIVVGTSQESALNLKVGQFFTDKKPITRGPASSPEGQMVRIFYATDRQPSSVPARYGHAFGAGRRPDGALSYGTAIVSIPRDHRMGELETSTFWSFSSLPTAADLVTLSRVNAEDRAAFFQDVHGSVASSATKSAFVFIHGYNASFEDAARRTAQMAYDLGFDGAPILYSWPSQGKPQGYPADEESVQWTVGHLRAFLEDVAHQSGARRIQIIAHSMGNRALLGALNELSQAHSQIRFQQVILTAPDIDADIFRQVATAVASQAGRVTLYASSADMALTASQRFHQFPRAGESGAHIVTVPGVDTIDATRVDTGFLGHSYYADNRSILADLFQLIRYDLPPKSRFGLEPQMWNQQLYWRFRP